MSNFIDVIPSRSRESDPPLDTWDDWTTWGRMALMNGQLEAAAKAFGRAATAADRERDPLIAEQLHAIEQLAYRLLALRRRRNEHRAAEAELEAAERRTLCELLDRVPRTGELPRAELHQKPDETAPPPTSGCRLKVDLLGPMEVAVDDVRVRSWSGGRARSLLAYLATHRTSWPSCEVLMEVFWPRSEVAAARNSLHVAIHGLRSAMRSVTDRPMIVRDGDTYGVHRSIQVRLDVEEFERRLARGRRHHEGGRRREAIVEYEGAAALYRGDLLVENPYDDWSTLPRERMRLALLDLLLRLSALYFAEERYTTCTELCRRILGQDPCNEETRRLLMRCHARQGHPQLALIEFRACVEALATQLRVAPDPATINLIDHIRRHERV